jgi:hypothetical protein
MALSDVTGVTSYNQSGNYNSTWLSITGNAAVLQPQVYQKLFKQAGAKAYLVELLKLLGNTIKVPDAAITTVEKAWPQHPIKLHDAVSTGGAGATATFVLHGDSYAVGTLPPWKVGDVIMVPATYQPTAVLTSRGYLITALTTEHNTNDTAVTYPLSNSTTLTKSQISTAIPANSWLMLAYNAFSRGSGQPTGMTDSFTTRTHQSTLSKYTIGIEGNVIARPYYPVTGLEGSGKFTSEKLVEAEFALDEITEQAILFGEKNENTSNLVETSGFTGSNAIAAGMGIYEWADLLAQKHQYTSAISFDDFLTIAQLFDSQDVINSTIQWLVGTKFNRDLESAGLDFIKEFSSGTDLYDKVRGRIGMTLRGVRLGGLEHIFYDIPTLSKAGGAGLMKAGEYVYEFPGMAIGIPMENVSYESFGKEPRTLPNVTLAYIAANGEDNTKLLKRLAGVSGAVDGLDVASSYHGMWYYMLTQYMIVVGEVNKWCLVRAAK